MSVEIPVAIEKVEIVTVETVEDPKPQENIEVPNVAPPAVPVESTNGAAQVEEVAVVKTNGDAKIVKEPEPPKDPRVDPIGWIGQQIAPAVHKINFHVLDWVQTTAVEDEAKRQPLPGKNDSVTRNQFLSFVRDGTVLAKLANKLAPGSVEPVHEDEAAKDKVNQTSNIVGFIEFAKSKAGLEEGQVFTVEDLQERGKAGFDAVFQTIFQIGVKAQEKFNQSAIDVERVVASASEAVKTSFFQSILAFFKRPQSDKQIAQAAEEHKEQNGDKPHTNGDKVEETHVITKIEAVPAVTTAQEIATN